MELLSFLVWLALGAGAGLLFGGSPGPGFVGAILTGQIGYLIGSLCQDRNWPFSYLLVIYLGAAAGATAFALVFGMFGARFYGACVGFVVGSAASVGFLLLMTRPPKLGHCAKCGYNLKGLPHNRCPECGTEFDPTEVFPRYK